MTLPDFHPLTPEISLYTPPSTPSMSTTPSLVILCTWLGAAEKHISKYTALHQTLSPTSSILLLKSGFKSMVSPYATQQRAMEPALSPILSILETSRSPPKILLHIFSNGGINSATHLFINLAEKRKQPIPLIGILCDSVPTGAGYTKTYNALRHSLPPSLTSFPTSILSATLIHTLLVLLFLSVAMGRYENPEDFWRKSILDEKLVDSKRIFYIASKVDKQTDWRDVVDHAEIARGKGWETKEVILEDTKHVNHMQKDPEFYRGLVGELWEKGKL